MSPHRFMPALALAIGLARSPAAAADNIVGGTVDPGHPAVVALMRGAEVWCTGTLVAPRMVVTAAHCLDATITAAAFGSVPGAADGVVVETVAQHAYPLHAPAIRRGDLGVVVLREPVLAVEPIALFDGALDAASLGARLRLVGFGYTAATEAGDRQKREGTARVATLEPTRIQIEPDPAQACFGDSGGPALLEVDGFEVLVGVVSSGDPSCTATAHLTRIDAYRAAFLDGFVAPATGVRCTAGTPCPGGLCIPAADAPEISHCTQACAADLHCPDPMSCADGACAYPAPSPGADDTPCQFGPDCASGVCAALADGGACLGPVGDDPPAAGCALGGRSRGSIALVVVSALLAARRRRRG